MTLSITRFRTRTRTRNRNRTRLPPLHWPLPALGAWALAWAAHVLLRGAGVPSTWALLIAMLLPLWPALCMHSRWRQGLVLLGFPFSAGVLGAGSGWPAWVWLLPLALLLALYPLRAWRDAPVYPTTPEALRGLETIVELPAAARILDAGSGLGHGLRALHTLWPQARLAGVERSALLALLSRLRCPNAPVRCADMWAQDWSGMDLVYLFQRPESMPRAWAKANAEMARGSWLVSLAFEVPGVPPTAVLQGPGRRPVHVYRLGAEHRPVPAQPHALAADKSPTTAHARAAG